MANAIESLNSVVRKGVNNRKLFPSDASATKVVFLAIEAASRQVRDWRAALNRFMIDFPDRMPANL